MGVLFISLPGAFAQMGAIGRVVGATFFIALVVAAITSAVSLLEVIAATLIDQGRLNRRNATLTAAALAAIVGIIPAVSLTGLGIMDQLAAELFTVIGVLGAALLVGWVMHSPLEEMLRGSGPIGARMLPAALFLVRYVWPLLLGWIAWIALGQTLTVLSGGS